MDQKIILGCIADDFTGGSDAASFLMAGGMNTVLLNGVPEKLTLPEGCEAVVIALKSRTQETARAVQDSLRAIRWLQDRGAEHFYIKYCSTFDSTPSGNIGPIVDAVLEMTGTASTILCPALPANGRTVQNGILFVNGVPLADSPMKDHPLTPMWASRIAELMETQGRHPSLELDRSLISDRKSAQKKVEAFAAEHTHFYVIPDYVDEADAENIVSLFGGSTVLTGGSGILTALARHLKAESKIALPTAGTEGPALLLAGSCSVATRGQICWHESHGGASIQLSDEDLLSGAQTPEAVWKELQALDSDAPLIYSNDTPEGLRAKPADVLKRVSALVEQTLSEVGALAVASGIKRIIVAGGETSGAVTRRLGWDAFQIGESIAPGVPILIPLDNPQIRLVLKSGNFGQEDFFERALRMTGGNL